MKKIVLIGLITTLLCLLLLNGCGMNSTDYKGCVIDCALVKCGYKGITSPVYGTGLDSPCPGYNQTMREYCYEECKGGK